MKNITFKRVMPHVFKGQDLHSDIWNANPEFVKGELYLVLADSGKGKSTFCSYILGYRSDYEGQILFDGEDVRSYNIMRWSTIRKKNISHLFQELRLFPELTAKENIDIKNALSPSKSNDEILTWFRQMGIEDKINEKASVMSFGQQQRVAMMRALCQPFDFLLVDEPISHLDDTNSQIMANIMLEEARRQGAAVIVTSIGKHMDLPYDKILKL